MRLVRLSAITVSRAHAVLLRIGLEGRQAQDGEVRHVAGKLAPLRADQQRADEQRVPGKLGEHARLDAVFRIGAAIEVLREKLLALGVLEEVVEQNIELLRRKLAVLLPPDRLLGGVVADDELVLRRAAGVDAGLGAERAALDDVAFVRARAHIRRAARRADSSGRRPDPSGRICPRHGRYSADPSLSRKTSANASGSRASLRGRVVNARRPVRVRPRPGPIMAILADAKAARRGNGASP